MIFPLTRQKFEQIIPLIATGPQYKYCWGKFPNFLQRVLVSVVAIAVIIVIEIIFRLQFGPIIFFCGVFSGLYWFWFPVFQASLKNAKCRSYKYSGFFRGRVLDWWITDSIVGKQETVNSKGELVIVENREKRINLEIGDETGFSVECSAPLRPYHKAIARGQVAEMIVMSSRPDLSRIEEFTNIYIPSRDIWVNDYPYVREDFFIGTSLRLREDREDRPRRRRPRPRD